MSERAAYVRGIAAKAHPLSNVAPDREAREMLTALAKIYEAEAGRIQQKATDERVFH